MRRRDKTLVATADTLSWSVVSRDVFTQTLLRINALSRDQPIDPKIIRPPKNILPHNQITDALGVFPSYADFSAGVWNVSKYRSSY